MIIGCGSSKWLWDVEQVLKCDAGEGTYKELSCLHVCFSAKI